MSEDFDEDKLLAESKTTKRDPFEIAREFEAKFHKDLALLGIIPADHYPRASECIEMMHRHIEALMERGLAYLGEDKTVYFASEKFPSYGAISGNRLTDLKPGHRYEFTESGAKRFHADWALWKAAGARREMIWDSPWGPGFPGWHIECSAMSLTFLHGHVDLHIGGIDLRFPHHENERAQSNPLIEQGSNQEAVDLWLHGEHLLFEGRKMSKSAGNVVLLSDVVERGFDPLSVRFCLMENRYRSQMDLSWDSIAAADKVLDRWRSITAQAEGAKNLTPAMTSIRDEIVGYLAADLDSPRALQRLRSLEKESAIPLAEKAQLFASIDPLLGLDLTATPKSKEKKLSEEDVALLESRSKARDDRDFAESDRIRELLASRGIEVRDLPTGQEWHWI
jgi:cysteinyl-tRNA synthetase